MKYLTVSNKRKCRLWIPASAGMTKSGAGCVISRAGTGTRPYDCGRRMPRTTTGIVPTIIFRRNIRISGITPSRRDRACPRLDRGALCLSGGGPGEPRGMSLRVRLMIEMWIPASAGMTKSGSRSAVDCSFLSVKVADDRTGPAARDRTSHRKSHSYV